MNTGFSIKVLLLTIILLIVSGSIFVVQQHEHGIVLQFKKVIRNDDDGIKLYGPGLHFKIPFVDKVVKVDSKIQSQDSKEDDVIPDSDNVYLKVNAYVKWRVADVNQFFLRTRGNFNEAGSLLERLIDEQLRVEIGKRKVNDLVTIPFTEEQIEQEEDDQGKLTIDHDIIVNSKGSKERKKILKITKDTANEKVSEYGIQIVDVRFKKMDFPDASIRSIYENMITVEQQKAAALRADGRKTADITRAEADAKVKVIQAEADQQARRIKGDGDAQAAEIYAKTYNKNPEFYAFLRSLDAYKKSFQSKSDIMLLNSNSDYFNYFKDQSGKKKK